MAYPKMIKSAVGCPWRCCFVMVCHLTIAWILSTSWAEARAGIFEKVQDKLVEITCETMDQADHILKRTSGTGFFVSPLGDIITSFHLIKNKHIKHYDPKFIDCWVSIGKKGSTNEKPPGQLPIEIIQPDETHDLLHLKVTTGRSDYKHFAVSSVPQHEAPDGTSVITVGFPESIPYKVDKPNIASIRGPEQEEEFWVTSDNLIEQGQSGSPVFLEKTLRVIGVIKGQDRENGKQGYIIPSHYIVRLFPDAKNYRGRDRPAGRLRIEVTVEGGKARQQHPINFVVKNKRGDPDRVVTYCKKASPGWEILSDSVHITFQKISSYSNLDGPPYGSTEQCDLLITGFVRNNGFTFPGYLQVLGTYEEVAKQSSRRTEVVFDEEVYPGGLSRSLPVGTQGYKVTFFDPSGKRLGELQSLGADGPLEIKSDIDLRSLSIEVSD